MDKKVFSAIKNQLDKRQHKFTMSIEYKFYKERKNNEYMFYSKL